MSITTKGKFIHGHNNRSMTNDVWIHRVDGLSMGIMKLSFMRMLSIMRRMRSLHTISVLNSFQLL